MRLQAEIEGQTYSLSKGAATVLQLEDEWYDDVENPRSVIAALKESHAKADILTFWQRLPDIEPRFDFHTEWESIAALPVKSFDHWWNKQIKAKTRNLVRKAEKSGVEVREACCDDTFVSGMTGIFNETPVRQGRQFWHYGKNFETVKQQFSRYLFREDLIGAYYRDELIRFVMLGNAGRYAVIGQIISRSTPRQIYQQRPNGEGRGDVRTKAPSVPGLRSMGQSISGGIQATQWLRGNTDSALLRTSDPEGQADPSTRAAPRLEEIIPLPVKNRLKRLRSRWLGVEDDRGKSGMRRIAGLIKPEAG
jgi:hypothetical protein